MMITWYLDDLKISHLDRKMVNDGDVRDSCSYFYDYFLGMDLNFSQQWKLRVSMANSEFYKEDDQWFSEAITLKAVMPARKIV